MKIAIFTFIFSALSFASFSQDVIWEKFYGGSNNDVAQYIINSDDGGFLTVGYTESFGTGVWGNPEMWLCKFDESGEMLWNKTYGEADSLDKAYFGLEIDDGYILIGERMKDITYGAGMCGIITKTDFDGNEIWSKMYKGDDKDVLRFIQPVAEDGYIACGATRSNGAGFIDGWLVKLDSDFNIEWESNFGTDNYETLKQVYPTDDGGYIAAGFSNSDDGLGSYDIWFVKTDSQGELEWGKRIGNEFSNRLNWFTPTSDGNYISTGRSQQDEAEIDELFVLKTTPEGEIIWLKYYPATVEGEGFYIEESLAHGYIVSAADANAIGGPWQSDGWLLRIDDEGELIWDYFVHGDASDQFYVARQNSEGDIVAAGGNMSQGPVMNELWITKFSDSTYTVGIEDELFSNDNSELFISPNPTSGLINIDITSIKSKNLKLNIIDTFGRSILQKNVENIKGNSISLDLSRFENGVYIVQIASNSKNYSEKIIVR